MSTIAAAQTTPVLTASAPTALVPSSAAAASSGSAFGAILDAINPLQHIPVVSGLFRAAQGTAISPVAQLAGDTLYGGLIGGAISSFASSLADIAVKGTSGMSISEHVIATVEDKPSAATPLVAVPASDTTASTVVDSTLKNQVDAATQAILRNGIHPEKVAGQYQRAQALDSTNKILMQAL